MRTGPAPRGEKLRTVTIITTEANAAIAPIHPRMPVILAETDWGKWLGEDAAGPQALKALLVPCPPDAIKAWPVSARVGNVKNDDAGLVEPVEIAAHRTAETGEPVLSRAVQSPSVMGGLRAAHDGRRDRLFAC